MYAIAADGLRLCDEGCLLCLFDDFDGVCVRWKRRKGTRPLLFYTLLSWHSVPEAGHYSLAEGRTASTAEALLVPEIGNVGVTGC